MISLDDYKPVTLGDKDLFSRHYKKYPVSHSENVYTTLVSWSHHTPAFYLYRDEQLFIMNMKDGMPQFRVPVGPRDDAALGEVFEIAHREGDSRAVIAIEETAKDWIEAARPETKVMPDRDFFDYVYFSKDLTTLPGRQYHRQRNYLSQFRRAYDYSVERMTPANFDETREFLDRWCRARECEKEPMLEAEVASVTYCVDHFRELELSGVILRIDGVVQALSVYERLKSDTAVIHYEKAMPGFDGIYPAINNETARILSGDYTYINRQSDLGIKGLRTAKKRLHPDHMEKLYYISRVKL